MANARQAGFLPICLRNPVPKPQGFERDARADRADLFYRFLKRPALPNEPAR